MAVLAVSSEAAGRSGAVVFGSWLAPHYADAACERVGASLDTTCSVRAVTIDGRRHHRAVSAEMDEAEARALRARARASGFSAWYLASQPARVMEPEPGGAVVQPVRTAGIAEPAPSAAPESRPVAPSIAGGPGGQRLRLRAGGNGGGAIDVPNAGGAGTRSDGQVDEPAWRDVADLHNMRVTGQGTFADIPSEFADVHHPGGDHQPFEWWRAFQDPVLNRVVDAALKSNLDLAQAVARVRQARARAKIASASQLPTVQATLGANTFDAPTNAGIGAQLDELGLGAELYDSFGVRLPDRLGLSTYALGADFAYEADFWGRDRNAALASGAESLASESDYRAARIGVIAQTVATYLEIVDLRSQRMFAGQIADVLTEQAVITKERYDAGLADIRELYAAERAAVDAQAALPLVDARHADAESRLWVLLGGYSTDLGSMLPESLAPVTPMDDVPSGIPADLLVQRPDVNAARQRVEAARYALGARRAALLPSLSLSGSIGLESSNSSDWFDPDQWYRNLSANLLAPVFQGGRLRSNVTLAEAQLDEAVAAFGRSVVTAVNEVDAALTTSRANRDRVSLLMGFVDEAAAEAALQEQRYRSGVGDYSTVLAASHHLLRARSILGSGKRELGLARLAVHRALGGAWTLPDVPVSLPRDSAEPEGLGTKLRNIWTKHVRREARQSPSDITE